MSRRVVTKEAVGPAFDRAFQPSEGVPCDACVSANIVSVVLTNMPSNAAAGMTSVLAADEMQYRNYDPRNMDLASHMRIKEIYDGGSFSHVPKPKSAESGAQTLIVPEAIELMSFNVPHLLIHVYDAFRPSVGFLQTLPIVQSKVSKDPKGLFGASQSKLAHALGNVEEATKEFIESVHSVLLSQEDQYIARTFSISAFAVVMGLGTAERELHVGHRLELKTCVFDPEFDPKKSFKPLELKPKPKENKTASNKTANSKTASSSDSGKDTAKSNGLSSNKKGGKQKPKRVALNVLLVGQSSAGTKWKGAVEKKTTAAQLISRISAWAYSALAKSGFPDLVVCYTQRRQISECSKKQSPLGLPLARSESTNTSSSNSTKSCDLCSSNRVRITTADEDSSIVGYPCSSCYIQGHSFYRLSCDSCSNGSKVYCPLCAATQVLKAGRSRSPTPKASHVDIADDSSDMTLTKAYCHCGHVGCLSLRLTTSASSAIRSSFQSQRGNRVNRSPTMSHANSLISYSKDKVVCENPNCAALSSEPVTRESASPREAVFALESAFARESASPKEAVFAIRCTVASESHFSASYCSDCFGRYIHASVCGYAGKTKYELAAVGKDHQVISRREQILIDPSLRMEAKDASPSESNSSGDTTRFVSRIETVPRSLDSYLSPAVASLRLHEVTARMDKFNIK